MTDWPTRDYLEPPIAIELQYGATLVHLALVETPDLAGHSLGDDRLAYDHVGDDAILDER